MKHYDFADRLQTLWDNACQLYARGRRDADTFFPPDEVAWLASNGLTAQHLYDYAEDFTSGGEPSWNTALAIELVRRDFFLNIQSGRASAVVLDEAALPPKDAAIRGIEWLPRIMPKARAKLHGELPPSLMYCCGGDRRFFQAHDIQPAEFLSLIWRHEDNVAAIVDWVARRSAANH